MSVQGNVVGNDGLVSWLIAQIIALGTLLASLAGWLPYAAIAALPSLYYAVMLWETRTFVHFRNNWRQKHIARKYVKLKQREKVTLAKLEAIELLRSARVEAREKVAHAAHEAEVMVVKQATNPLPPKS